MSQAKKNKTKHNLIKNSIAEKIAREMAEAEKEALAKRPAETTITRHEFDEEPGQLDLFDYPANAIHQYPVHKDVERQFEGLMDNLVRYDEIVKLFGMSEMGIIDGRKLKDAIKEVIFHVGNAQGLTNKYIPELPQVVANAEARAAELYAQSQDLPLLHELDEPVGINQETLEILPHVTAEGVINHA